MTEKGYKESFGKFFENPDRTTFRELLKDTTGEYAHIDFKENWLDYPKLAKHILGLSNSEGGVLVIGVKEEDSGSLTTVGIDSFKDKTEIKSKLQNYLPLELSYEVIDFDYGDEAEWGSIRNKKFQVLIVEDTPQYLPFISLKASDELHKNRIYYRGKTNTEETTHEELKKIINRRLDTNVSTTAEDEFREHIEQLEILYSFLDKYHANPLWMSTLSMLSSLSQLSEVKNPKYPEEDFEDFIVRMIDRKKEIIENVITLQ